VEEFITFAIVGFCAQLIDGALGMGFGVISSSILLAQGVHPALVSASVNAAKLPTSGTAALSHHLHGNLNWELVRSLALFGSIGGILGALLLTSLKGALLQVLVNLYLFGMGALIVYRGIANHAPKLMESARARTIGLAGGSIEGIGGSWGPIVTTSLLGSGVESRYAIGSSNFSEFVVSFSVFSAFFITYYIGHWGADTDWHEVTASVSGLVIGGIPAAVMGGYLSKRAPRRPLTIAVGSLALAIAVYRTVFVS
jgi:hypothetical protein